MGRVAVIVAVLVAGVTAFAAAPAAGAWKPGPARYGVGSRLNVPVTMSDGTILRVDIYYPTDPKTGKEARGRFPALIVQTPYGKQAGQYGAGSSGPAAVGSEIGPVPYLIKRGYIDVVADVRGTGDSQGAWGLFDPVQGQDGATLVRWAARLPQSTGKVGLYGPSYMGIDQFLTARNLGRHSPLKAMFPIIAGNDLYRDVAFGGGMAGAEFDLVYLGLTASLNTANPIFENPAQLGDLLSTEAQHLGGLASYHVATTLGFVNSSDQSFDQAYWQERNPRNMLAHAVATGVPAFLVGGFYDLFQRGEPLNYSGLQNAYRHRSVAAPMLRTQRVTGRYQLVQGPWYHLTAGNGIDLNPVQLAWFNRWLKGQNTGIERTRHPLHLYALGAGKWLDASRYPLSEARAHTYYLSNGPSGSGAPSTNDGTLKSTRPTAKTGADPVAFTGANSPCDRQTEQWGAGPTALALEAGQLPPSPCTTDDRSIQTGPGALTYTTPALKRATMLAGPIDATIYASSTRPELELEATLEDVAPGGASVPITSGPLLGSFRKLDKANSWFAADGRPLIPYHPYTRASVKPVPTGAVTRFDIEVFPTFASLAKGHRLRLTLTTTDTPHLLPSSDQFQNLVGGVYQVQRRAGAASFLEVPLASPSAFRRCSICG